MEPYTQASLEDLELAERFHEAGGTLAAALHAASVTACKALGLVEIEHLVTHAGTAEGMDLPIDMLVNDRGHRPNARSATAFVVVPGSSDIEDPYPEIILGIQGWEAKGYRLSDDAVRQIEASREFMGKLISSLEEDDY